MPVDASIPLSVNQWKPYDQVEGTAKAYTLKSMVDQDKEHQNALQERQQLKDIYGKADLSTPEGQQQTLKSVGAVSPEQRMTLQKNLTDQQKAQADIEKNKSITAKNQMDRAMKFLEIGGRTASAALDTYSQLKANNVSDAVAMAKAQAVQTQGMIEAHDAGVINDDQFKQMMAKPFNPQQAQAFVQNATSQKDRLTQQQKAIEDAEKKRHNISEEGIQRDRNSIIRERMSSANGDGGLSGDALDDAATRLAHGDSSVLTNLGRGAQGSKNIMAIRNRAAEIARKEGLSADEQTAKGVQLGGEKAGARTAGTRAANLGIAGVELDKFSDIALTASGKVPRTQFVPLNRAMLAVQKGTGSPEVSAFVAANQSVINAFAQITARSGVPTDSARHHAEEMLNTAQTPEQYKAVIKQLKIEAKAASESASEVQKQQTDRMTGRRTNSGDSHPQDIQDLLNKYGK